MYMSGAIWAQAISAHELARAVVQAMASSGGQSCWLFGVLEGLQQTDGVLGALRRSSLILVRDLAEHDVGAL